MPIDRGLKYELIYEDQILGITRYVYRLDHFTAFFSDDHRYCIEQRPVFIGRMMLATKLKRYFQLGASDNWAEMKRRNDGVGIVWVAVDFDHVYHNFNLMGVRNTKDEAATVARTRKNLREKRRSTINQSTQ